MSRLIKLTCAVILVMQGAFLFRVCAQTLDLSAPVSFHYDGVTVANILDDLAQKHNIGFSYSRQIIPIHQRIYCHVDKMPFGQAMETLFAQTQVVFGVIGDQIVLGIDLHKSPIVPDMGFFEDNFDASVASTDDAMIKRMRYEIPSLSYYQTTVQYASIRTRPEVVAYDLHHQLQSTERRQSYMRAQVTFVPPFQADTDPDSEQPLNFSLNVLAGVNTSVKGVEFGGLVNILKDDLKGIQTAGLVNSVGNRFDGFQAAGLVNTARGQGSGFQAAGLANVAAEGDIVQAAGLLNLAHGNVRGQVSGLVNIAKDVHGAQAAGLVNVARNVKGAQIGLFNFADSVGGVPIGLISVVRNRGYHSLELGVEDAIDYNLNVRLGVRAFYNILHVGVDNHGENWSLGYGLGTSIHLPGQNYLQFELMSRHVNEGEPWTSELNLLSQLKMTYDFALGRNVRFAIGPSFNVSTSRRYSEDTGKYGTDIPRYVMFEHTYDDGFHLPLNVKYWIGLHAGIRFGSTDHRYGRSGY